MRWLACPLVSRSSLEVENGFRVIKMAIKDYLVSTLSVVSRTTRPHQVWVTPQHSFHPVYHLDLHFLTFPFISTRQRRGHELCQSGAGGGCPVCSILVGGPWKKNICGSY